MCLTKLEIAALAWSIAFWRSTHELDQSPGSAEHKQSSHTVPLPLHKISKVTVTSTTLAHGLYMHASK